MQKENEPSRYKWRSAATPHTGEYLSPVVLNILDGLNAQAVMDFGSGNGALCGCLSQAGYDVVGAEYSAEGVAVASDTYPHIRFYQADLTSPLLDPFPGDALFDAVVSTEVVEHLYSPDRFVANACSVLKPGGHFILSTPYHGYLKNLLIAITGKWDEHHTALWHGGHIKFWSRKTLTTLLQENGLRVVSFHGAGRCPLLWKSMVLVAVKDQNETVG